LNGTPVQAPVQVSSVLTMYRLQPLAPAGAGFPLGPRIDGLQRIDAVTARMAVRGRSAYVCSRHLLSKARLFAAQHTKCSPIGHFVVP